MIRVLSLFILLVVISGCAVKSSPFLIDEKNSVIERVRSTMPDICTYKGRTVVRYLDEVDTTNKFSAIVLIDKSCTNDMDLRILGGFGTLYAEVFVRDKNVRIFQNKRDVTDDWPILISDYDLALMERYLKLPPMLPDERYIMMTMKNGYLFVYGNTYISVTPDFYIDAVITPSHKITYAWKDKVLNSIVFYKSNSNLTVDFSDKWKAE